jgi:hypothetical protein
VAKVHPSANAVAIINGECEQLVTGSRQRGPAMGSVADESVLGFGGLVSEVREV